MIWVIMGNYGRQWDKFKLIFCSIYVLYEMTHKPGSVNLLINLMIINLEQMSPFASSGLPE